MSVTQSFRMTDGNIASAVAVVGPFDVTNYNTVVVAFSGTYAGVTANFEATLDGTNWFPVFGSNTSAASVVSSPALGTNQIAAYDIIVGPFIQFRIRSSAWTSGSALTQVAFGTESYDPAPNVQVVNSAVLGTGANVIGAVTPVAAFGSGGVVTNHHLVAAATTNATSVKASAGSIGSIVLANTAAAIKFFKLFNKASAPTVGTDVPTVTVGIPPTSTLFWDPAIYYRMTTGIAYAITNLSPDLDATAVTAGDVIVSIQYA